MLDYLKIIYEAATDTPPKEAIGALMVGFFLALACSSLCVVLQKRTSNPLPLLCGLIFLAIAGSMAIGAGQSRYRQIHGANQAGWTDSFGPARPNRSRFHPPMPPPFGWQLLQEADLDRNGQLTPEEAAQFVRKADKAGKGWADMSDLDRDRRRNTSNLSIHVSPTASVPDHANQDRL